MVRSAARFALNHFATDNCTYVKWGDTGAEPTDEQWDEWQAAHDASKNAFFSRSEDDYSCSQLTLLLTGAHRPKPPMEGPEPEEARLKPYFLLQVRNGCERGSNALHFNAYSEGSRSMYVFANYRSSNLRLFDVLDGDSVTLTVNNRNGGRTYLPVAYCADRELSRCMWNEKIMSGPLVGMDRLIVSVMPEEWARLIAPIEAVAKADEASEMAWNIIQSGEPVLPDFGLVRKLEVSARCLRAAGRYGPRPATGAFIRAAKAEAPEIPSGLSIRFMKPAGEIFYKVRNGSDPPELARRLCCMLKVVNPEAGWTPEGVLEICRNTRMS